MNTEQHADLADECHEILNKLAPGTLYSGETKNGKNSLIFFCRPSAVYFIAAIEIGPKSGLIGTFITYDERQPIAADRVEYYKGPYGARLGPLEVPYVRAGDPAESRRAAKNAMEQLMERFEAGELSESGVLTACGCCSYAVRDGSIKGLIGGKCSPS